MLGFSFLPLGAPYACVFEIPLSFPLSLYHPDMIPQYKNSYHFLFHVEISFATFAFGVRLRRNISFGAAAFSGPGPPIRYILASVCCLRWVGFRVFGVQGLGLRDPCLHYIEKPKHFQQNPLPTKPRLETPSTLRGDEFYDAACG